MITINWEDRMIELEDGHITPIDTMLDKDKNETDDPDKCVAFVFQLANGLWSFSARADLVEAAKSRGFFNPS